MNSFKLFRFDQKIYLIVVFTCFTLFYSCVSQRNYDETNLKTQANRIASIYYRFYQNRYDYDENARDTILDRFKSTLLNTLSNNEYASVPFDSLSKSDRVTIIESKDKKLRIFSWDESNGGTRHVYNSAYQYNTKKKSYGGILSLEGDRLNSEPLFTDIIHFKIQKIKENLYLIKGYGTHGHGYDFYVFRLLSFENNSLSDCNKCFDGKDRFVFYKPRGFDSSPTYNTKTQEISYPEMETDYKDGEDSGFTNPTGKILKLKFKDGSFVKIN